MPARGRAISSPWCHGWVSADRTVSRPPPRKRLPVYLDDPVQQRLTALAEAQGIELSSLFNNLLRRDIERIDAAR